MKSIKRIKSSSSVELGIKDYGCVENNKFNKEYKLSYLEYPLKNWKNIVYEQDVKNSKVINEGKYYEYIVNIIFEKDIFKDLEFHKEKNSIFDFDFKDCYKIDYSLLKKGDILPDFFVHKIPMGKFLQILDERKFMLLLRNNIPKDKKYISIVGENKISLSNAHKKDYQRQDYLTFINSVNNLNNSSNSDEFLIMMYIYDISFLLFKNKETYYNVDNEPIIYGYMPKFYYEDCYKSYNDIIDQLKQTFENKIDFKNKVKLKKKKSKRQDINEYKSLLKEYKSLLEEKKRLKRLLYVFIIIIFVLQIIIVIKSDLKLY